MADVTLMALDGDTLDALIWREAALGPAALQPVLAANPGLSTNVELAAGAPVRLPATADTPPVRTIRQIWD
ncbi:tail protein X [Novosphingopyxis sp. YJ-S2-01]|uniref:tail protein X n=1 Tax=Novosphingopyxis sp. YJ-S2-01 TaxID=2794021 RepID=UPI0018DE29AE|nr:tail protein X [Novosphingopyxis sp. YJ-S2-01]MBH9537886.1 tail protein X [Novosphingopyxis sp. YJ-S2-01]